MKRKISILVFTIFTAVTFISCGGSSNNEKRTENKEVTAVVYTCPMHSEVESDKPGDCPKCGMALEEKK